MVQLVVNRIVRHVFRHHFFHLGHRGHVVVTVGYVDQFIDVAGYLAEIVPTHFSNTYFLVEGWLRALLFTEYLFIKFLAGTEPGKLDFHILCTRELNHTLGQIGNLHRFAHVEHKDVAATAFHTGFEHKFAGFGDEHEETDDVRMGHRDG